VEQKNSSTYKIDKKYHKDILSFIKLNEIGDVDIFINKCFKKGFDIERFGLLGGETEVKEVEKIVEKIVEIPVEKIVEKIVNIYDNDDEKIFQLNKDFDEERQKFSIKIEEMENIFQKEKNELISQIGKPNDKTKMLENTLLNLRKELQLKQTTINELEDKVKSLEEQLSKNVNAIYLKGSNLNQKI